MKKKILGLAAIAMSLIALPSVAQNKKNNDGRKKEARIENTQCTKDFKKGDRATCIFEGLTLSDTQKDQLKQLNEKQLADRKARKEACAPSAAPRRKPTLKR